MPYIIYKILNTVNDMLYVGSTTTSLKTRWSQHRGDAFKKQVDKPLYRAMREYGADKFFIELLEECPDASAMRNREITWMRELSTVYPQGYNLRCPLLDTEAAIVKYDAFSWELEEYVAVFGLCVGSMKLLRGFFPCYQHITQDHLPKDIAAYRQMCLERWTLKQEHKDHNRLCPICKQQEIARRLRVRAIEQGKRGLFD